MSPKTFEPITTTGGYFTLNYFKNFTGPLADPDNDAIDPQN
jgi:hypothetical protein